MKEIGIKLSPIVRKVLNDYLDDDEKVFDAISSVWSIYRGTDILFYTDIRLVRVRKRPWRLDVDSFYYDDDPVLELDAGPVLDTLKINFKGESAFEMPIFSSRRDEVLGFVHRAEKHIQKHRQPDITEGLIGREKMFKEQLTGLAELKEKGIITEEEFLKKKKEILRKM